jgi:hypothetical protein
MTVADPAPKDFFGSAAALSSDGGTALIGAYEKALNGGTYTGKVYLFARVGTTWLQQAEQTASDAHFSDEFGISVALSSDAGVALVGADGNNARGAVYVYQVNAPPPPTPGSDTPTPTPTPTTTSPPMPTDTSTPVPTDVPTDTPPPTSVPTSTPAATASPTPPPVPTVTATPTTTPISTDTPTDTAPEPTPTATATVPGCAGAPVAGCRTPSASGQGSLYYRDVVGNDAGDELRWKWSKGAVTSKAEFGTPLTTTSYRLCIYDGTSSLIFDATTPAGRLCGASNPKPCWKDKPHGFDYSRKDLTPDGVAQMKLKEGTVAGKAQIQVRARGALLDDPALPFAQPVVVQLHNAESGLCWEAVYGFPATANVAGPPVGQFKDKAD